LITLIIFLFLAEAIYLKGVIGISETHAKRKAYSQEELASLTKESSPLTALLLKELRFLFRTPAYFMNCILSNLLLPVVMVIAFILNSGELSKLPDLLLRFLEGNTGFVQSIVFLFSVFLGSANNIAATAISREGKNFYVNKYLPVPYLTHIWAKLLSGVIISLIPIILVIAALIVLIHPSVLFIFLSSMTAVLGILFASLVGVLIDLKYPKLDWANEQRAVKSNINGLLSLLLNSLIAGLTVFMMFRLDVPAWTGYIVLLGLTLAYNLILIWILAAKGEKWFGQIEA
jgi:ABC-2 type transport system permease protein